MRVVVERGTDFRKGFSNYLAGATDYRQFLTELENLGLPDQTVNKVIVSGMRAAGLFIRKEMRKRIRNRTGALSRSIKIRSRSRKREVDIRVEAPHWYILEFGRRPGTTKDGRRYAGAPPYPFIEPAFNDTQQEQVKIAIDKMREELTRLARQT